VEPTIDATTRLGRVRISVDSSDQLRAGMFVEAEIIAAERETLAVPISAVGSGPDGLSVMRVVDGVVERAAVTTGIRDGGLVEIVTGLAPGDQVVTKAGAFVRAGDRINPVLASEPLN
jgi:HlyD family secretion protein